MKHFIFVTSFLLAATAQAGGNPDFGADVELNYGGQVRDRKSTRATAGNAPDQGDSKPPKKVRPAFKTFVSCDTDKPGWAFDFVGTATIDRLILSIPRGTNPEIWDEQEYFSTGGGFQGPRFYYDGRQLTIYPDPVDFPEGLVLHSTRCDA